MPVIYRCKKCGYVLYVFWRVGQDSYGVPTPSEVISMYGGICPRCGRKLETRPDPLKDVKVYARSEVPRELVEKLRELRRPPRPL